jgi:hypothetical protein
MWRSVFLAWLFGDSAQSDEISPWVHALNWGRLEEQFERNPTHPTVVDVVELLDEAERHRERAFAHTFGWVAKRKRMQMVHAA